MTDTELKPCPFCGEPAEKTRNYLGVVTLEAYRCSNSFCNVNPFVSGTSYEMAAERWNTRPVEDALRDYINALETSVFDVLSEIVPSFQKMLSDPGDYKIIINMTEEQLEKLRPAIEAWQKRWGECHSKE
jgi:hypothetical protein